jgi:hypothetical protein
MGKCDGCGLRKVDCLISCWIEEEVKNYFGAGVRIDQIVECLAFKTVQDPSEFEVTSIVIPEVRTLEEARLSSCYYFSMFRYPAHFSMFRYPAHSVDSFLKVGDLRFLEWMKKVSSPLTKSNSWDPYLTAEQAVEAVAHLEFVADNFRRFCCRAVVEQDDEQQIPFGVGLAIDDCSATPASDVVHVWLNDPKCCPGFSIGQVGYSTPLHEIWLGFVRD